jgi:hypothetical protein
MIDIGEKITFDLLQMFANVQFFAFAFKVQKIEREKYQYEYQKCRILY